MIFTFFEIRWCLSISGLRKMERSLKKTFLIFYLSGVDSYIN